MEIQSIKTEIREIFDPIASMLGLHSYSECSRSNTEFSVAYLAEKVGLELNIDLSDFFIYALLIRPTGGDIPVGYQDDSGRRQKVYLQEALKEVGVDIQEITLKLQRMGGDCQNCSGMLAVLSELIKENWEVLVEERQRWFGSENEKDKS